MGRDFLAVTVVGLLMAVTGTFLFVGSLWHRQARRIASLHPDWDLNPNQNINGTSKLLLYPCIQTYIKSKLHRAGVLGKLIIVSYK